MTTLRGTWDDPAIVSDPRIDHEDALVRAVAERLHSNESMHMHDYIQATICPYCALRTSRVLRWAREPVGYLDPKVGYYPHGKPPSRG